MVILRDGTTRDAKLMDIRRANTTINKKPAYVPNVTIVSNVKPLDCPKIKKAICKKLMADDVLVDKLYNVYNDENELRKFIGTISINCDHNETIVFLGCNLQLKEVVSCHHDLYGEIDAYDVIVGVRHCTDESVRNEFAFELTCSEIFYKPGLSFIGTMNDNVMEFLNIPADDKAILPLTKKEKANACASARK